MEKLKAKLHLHTEYSLLDSTLKIKELVKKAKELGYTSISATDHGNLFSLLPFYKECIENDIKPILGVETYLPITDTLEKDADNRKNYHLCLYAKNNEGYKNLLKIVSLAYTEGFYYRPRVNKAILKKYSKGLIASSACIQGEIYR
ncbi:MAG: PHP domain-containing protein [Candidatus Woesearchaeota archaeon]